MIEACHELVVVTPVYEDAEAFARLCQDLAAQFGRAVCVVAVDDGSLAQPLDIKGLVLAGLDGGVLRLRRNLGHQGALAIGLAYVAEQLGPRQRVVLMDCDGEDLPVTVPLLLAALESDQVDLVVARRRRRVEGWRFKASYALYKRWFRLLTGQRLDFGNFMALKPAAVHRLAAMPECSQHLAAAVLVSRLRRGTCTLDRGARYAGQSKMNFSGLVLHGLRGLAVLAELVWLRVGLACGALLLLAGAGAVSGLLWALAGQTQPGWLLPAAGWLAQLALPTGALALGMLMLATGGRCGRLAAAGAHREAVAQVLASAAPWPPA